MDNVTHTLAGLLLAESAVRLRARRSGSEPSPRFRAVAAVSSMIAANLPDADLLYTGIGGDRLAYMLHHRGYSHTLLVAMLAAPLLWGAAMLLWRWRARAAPGRGDAAWLFWLVLSCVFSHLLLDWTNSYGVHPFWPLDDRWRYGDAVFIVEPWFWVAAVPALVAASTRRAARVLLSLVLSIGLLLAWRIDLVATGAAAALTLGAVLSIALARALRPGARAAAAIVGWVAVGMVMGAGAGTARGTARAAVASADPAAELLDLAVSPLPANPLCAEVIAMERSGGVYRVTTGRVSAAPELVDAASCAARSQAGPAFHSSPRPSTRAMRWDAEWTAPAGELAALARESCPALAALRFIRAPIWRTERDSTVLLGDVRYGGGSGGGFTDVSVPRRSAACPRAVPPWTPPRADLLGYGKAPRTRP